jgi:hypothetical protein
MFEMLNRLFVIAFLSGLLLAPFATLIDFGDDALSKQVMAPPKAYCSGGQFDCSRRPAS